MSNPSITIRRAKSADFDHIQRLNAELFKFEGPMNGQSRNAEWPFTDHAIDYFHKCIDGRDGFAAFMAELNGRVIGYLAASVYAKPWMTANTIAEIDNMFVEEAYRRQSPSHIVLP